MDVFVMMRYTSYGNTFTSDLIEGQFSKFEITTHELNHIASFGVIAFENKISNQILKILNDQLVDFLSKYEPEPDPEAIIESFLPGIERHKKIKAALKEIKEIKEVNSASCDLTKPKLPYFHVYYVNVHVYYVNGGKAIFYTKIIKGHYSPFNVGYDNIHDDISVRILDILNKHLAGMNVDPEAIIESSTIPLDYKRYKKQIDEYSIDKTVLCIKDFRTYFTQGNSYKIKKVQHTTLKKYNIQHQTNIQVFLIGNDGRKHSMLIEDIPEYFSMYERDPEAIVESQTSTGWNYETGDYIECLNIDEFIIAQKYLFSKDFVWNNGAKKYNNQKILTFATYPCYIILNEPDDMLSYPHLTYTNNSSLIPNGNKINLSEIEPDPEAVIESFLGKRKLILLQHNKKNLLNI